MRLNKDLANDLLTTFNPAFNNNNNLTELNDFKLSPSAPAQPNTSLNKSSDNSVCVIEDDDFPTKTNIEIEDLTNDDDVIEEDDDDCRIISEAESQTDRRVSSNKRVGRGLHMNDELNVPDANGQVLINVNHPPEDADIYLIPYLARNVKSHQIGGIRFMYDNIVESLSRVKEKTNGFGCILAHAMGLGKTLQIISFIEIFLRCTSGQRVLCIVPINTIQNWLCEFNNWLPENGQQRLDADTIINYRRPFKVYLINDFAKTQKQRYEIILDWRNTGGVLLIGYEMFRTLVSNNPKTLAQTKAKTSKKVWVILIFFSFKILSFTN